MSHQPHHHPYHYHYHYHHAYCSCRTNTITIIVLTQLLFNAASLKLASLYFQQESSLHFGRTLVLETSSEDASSDERNELKFWKLYHGFSLILLRHYHTTASLLQPTPFLTSSSPLHDCTKKSRTIWDYKPLSQSVSYRCSMSDSCIER
ncbi:uncharacterized protein LOC141598959 [Silene latifolia]|uniref:uncharacterized protein LOC141598959 n=1 Tax=Silene latifolia TaxID=37657 RepID=UPI003D777B22